MRLPAGPRAALTWWRAAQGRHTERRRTRRNARIDARVRQAQDPNSNAWTLARLTATSAWEPAVGRALAANPATPGWCLRRLARRQWDVAAEVARNAHATPAVLKRLAASAHWAVQAAAATNPATPAKSLSGLCTWFGPYLRVLVATNPNLPASDVDRLLQDDSVYVRAVAARHPSASAEALEKLAAPMSEPAWLLRAVAANPACPEELSEQVLTWLALGGAGNSDAQFDPLECKGHPGDTATPVYSWYRDEARKPNAEQHALWRVRAAVTTSLERIPIPVLSHLAEDPRPEVRRTAARFKELPWPRLRELRQDDDASVRRLADSAWENKRKQPGARPRQTTRWGWARRLIVIVAVLNLIRLVSGNGDGSGGASNPTIQPPDAVPSSITGDIVSAAGGTPTDRAALPGGGSVVAGHLSQEGLDYLTIVSSATPLDISVPATVMTDSGSTSDGPLHLAIGESKTVFVITSSSSIVLTVRGQAASVHPAHIRVSFKGGR